MPTFYMDYENGLDANDGSDWANAWKTITAGPTAARIAPGDEIRIAKSPDPVSIGDATWNDLSKVVTLAAALTLLVDDCESGWAADNASTVTHPTTAMKSGSANVQITKAAYATNTLYAHKDLGGAVDFSDHTGLSLWVRNDAAIADGARWKVCLCSDDAGAVIVDTFWIPAIPSTNRWVCLSLEKDGGGALGAAIESIAVYSGTSAPTNGQDILLDNVNACDFGGFSIQSLISKSSAAQSTSEGWYGIQSINGVTVLLDNDTNTLASAGKGYSGTTETVTTYRRETIKTAMAANSTDAVQAVQEGGSAGSHTTFSGGWNTSNNTQDGETFFDGLNGLGYGLHLSNNIKWTDIERLSLGRYNTGFRAEGNPTNDGIYLAVGTIHNTAMAGLAFTGAAVMAVVTVAAIVNGVGLGVTWNALNSDIDIGSIANMTTLGIQAQAIASGCVNNRISVESIRNLGATSSHYAVDLSLGQRNVVDVGVIRDVAGAAFNLTTGTNVLRNTTIANGTEISTGLTTYLDARLYSQNHNDTGYHRIFTDGGQIDSLATDFAAPASGSMWKLLTSATTRTGNYPLWLEMPGIAVVANKLVTIKAVMKKAHATQVNGRLVLRGGQIAGVDDDVVATLADSTAEQELTLTFTPTESGVVVPEVWAEYVSGHAAVYIDRFTEISQAA